MNFLVFSDSHGRYAEMRTLIDRMRGEIDAVLHLGDGAAEVFTLRSMYPGLPIHAVLGNCDGDFPLPRELLLPADGKTLFLSHGDRQFVQAGHTNLMEYAKRRGADAALFGHCHICCEEYVPADPERPGDRPFWLFSPGSISRPRDGAPSFGRLHISESGVCFSVGRL